VEINAIEIQHHLNKMQIDTLDIKVKGIGFRLASPFGQGYQNPMQMQDNFWNKKWVRKRPRNNILRLM
jgi:hypothetical protein